MTDFQFTFFWWLIFFVAGLSTFPMVYKLFGKFLDGGYGISKTFSLIFISYIVFLFSSLRIIPFTRFSVIMVLILLAVSNYLIFEKNKIDILRKFRKVASIIIFEELLFATGLFFWAYVRSFQPDINGLEKFMDFGYVNTLLKTVYLPPQDMWFSGKAINYYWFGHYITALVTKLSGFPSGITYNLMLGSILGLALSGGFSLISALLYAVTKIRRFAVVGGLVAVILLNFSGNFHTPYYVLKNGLDSYWYPDATRFIGYNPDTNDKTIHEFPIYSYVVSDLHAHLINFPFVILYMSLIYLFIKKSKNKLFLIPIIGTLLGTMFMTNAWDFANYLLLTGFALFFVNLRRYSLSFKSILETAIPIIGFIVFALISSLPFTLKFESIAEGAAITTTKTPAWQLLVLWGFPLVLTVIFTIFTLIKRKDIKKEDVFVFALIVTGWFLIALPEFVYVKDIYVASHYRANTMFKLTYQAFVMFYLTSGYIAIRTITSFRSISAKFLTVLFFTILFGSIMYYPKIAIKSYYADLKVPRGLNGEIWLKEQRPETYEAIEWFRDNTEGQPVILEAAGDSYTEYNSISSYTGLPTVSGWFVHEWLWRGSPEAPQERVNEITEIYNTKEVSLAKSYLDKYNVEYVVVGTFEKEKYPELSEEKFSELGETVFSSGTTKIYRIR